MTNQYMLKAPINERFWALVRKTPSCWFWLGAKSREGYGFFTPTYRHQVRAHRFVYELMVGPIPKGKQIDHLCRVPSCVNPAHLEVVTSRENTLRGTTAPARNAKKTRCPRGHEYSRTQFRSGRRRCQRCENAQTRARYRANPRAEGVSVSYMVQTWKNQERVSTDIEGLSIDAARHIAQVHAGLGYIGRVVPEDDGDWEVYLPDGTVRKGPFEVVTMVTVSQEDR